MSVSLIKSVGKHRLEEAALEHVMVVDGQLTRVIACVTVRLRGLNIYDIVPVADSDTCQHGETICVDCVDTWSIDYAIGI